MLYELEDQIIFTDVSSVRTPRDNYFYGAIHKFNKSSEEFKTLCIRAFNTKEEAEKWVKESFRSRFPNIEYKG